MALFRSLFNEKYPALSAEEKELFDLRLKVEFYEDILNGLPNDLVVFDTEHRYLFLNKIAVNNDSTRQFMLGKTDYDYCTFKGINNNLALHRHQQFKEVVESAEPKTWEEKKDLNGGQEVISRTLRPVYDRFGQLKYVLGFGTDISSLRETENRLRDKIQELEQIMDNSFTAIAIADNQFKVLEWNKTAREIFGYTSTEMIGTCPGENLMLHKNPSGIENFCSKLVQDHDLLGKRFESDMRHKNGHLLDVEILINPFQIGENNYHAVFLHDVTEKKQAQKTVSALATFPEEDPNVVFRVNASDFNLVYANPATYLLFEDRDAIINFINTSLKEVLTQTLQTNTHERIEVNYNKAVYTIAVWPNLQDGYINLYATDITIVKNAEQQLQRMNLSLKEEVENRTKELRESNKNLEHFAYSISHDLRAPLRHVVGYASLLVEDEGHKLTNDSLEYIHRIQNSGRKMEKQIDGLLQFSRYGTQKLKKQVITLKPLFDSAIEVFSSYYKPEELVYTNKAEVAVLADPVLLNLVIENLVSNAIKYAMPKKSVHLTITAQQIDRETVVCICDNGVGFNMRYYDQIFGIFNRLHTEQEFEGMGLGLANVQRILGRHGGRIWAESKPGEGSCFYFSLPVAVVV